MSFRFRAYATEFGETKQIIATDNLANASAFAEGQFINRGYDKVVIFDYAGSSPRVAIEHTQEKDIVCEWEKPKAKPRGQ